MQYVLQALYEGLTTHGEAYVQVNDSNLLAVRLFREPSEHPPVLREYDVPMMLKDKAVLAPLPWDIAVQRILPTIDNVSCVRKIAHDADVDVQSTKRCLRILLFYECIFISDIFQFSNKYVCTDIIA
ncbi:unnamed protein product, partial [Symbiodinium microadriaticum]